MKIVFGKIGIDKVYHFYAGLSLALFTLFILLLVRLLGGYVSPQFTAVVLSLAALFGGILKDLYDALIQKEDFDVLDVLFTWLGSVPVEMVWIEVALLIS